MQTRSAMFSLPTIIVLLVLIYLRPQEFIPAARAWPLLHLVSVLSLLGLLLDVSSQRGRARLTPQLACAALFFAWCVCIGARGEVGSVATVLVTPCLLFFVIALGPTSFRPMRTMALALLGIGLVLSLVAVHQGRAPFGCILLDDSASDGTGTVDGRECTSRHDCAEEAEPDAEYLCERIGLLGTSTIGSGARVRYRGILNDPNELALAVAVALPFAIALVEERRSIGRVALLAVAVAGVGACTVMTQSRGGQIVLLVVIGVYSLKRWGLRGAALGGLLVLPLLLYGGRSGAEADSSSLERLEAWRAGLAMVREHPLFGVGVHQFVDHHTQTAHNAYLLAAAELGLPGMVCFTATLYLSLKIPIQALRTLPPDRKIARAWATALLASLSGLAVGIFFLSFCYHPVLWIHLGLTAAYSAALADEDPGWRVRFGAGDLAWTLGIAATILAAMWTYCRFTAA
jgi:hypothetical protein